MPEELPLATVAEEEDCLGAPIRMLGYPGHDTESWPKLGERAQATLREGIVCRLSDFHGGNGGDAGELQKLQHSLASWHGFSGSPLFLPNGHVVGLHNSGRGVTIEMAGVERSEPPATRPIFSKLYRYPGIAAGFPPLVGRI